MPLRSGLNAQLGLALETTYGTYVAPARFHPFVSESMDQQIARMESEGLEAGKRVLDSSDWMDGEKTIAGELNLEMRNTGLGLLFHHAFGTVATANPLATAFEHTFTPGAFPVGGLSIQIGRPDVSLAGVTHPFSYLGCRIEGFTVEGVAGEIAKCSFSIIGQDETTAQTLGAATYPAATTSLTFVDGDLKIASSSIKVRAASFSGANGFVSDRTVLGSQIMEEPVEGSQFRAYDGTVDAHFVSLTDYNRFINGTEALLDLNFQGVDIEAALPFAVEIQANVRFDGQTPQVSGPDEIPQILNYKVVDESQLKLVYRTTDATP